MGYNREKARSFMTIGLVTLIISSFLFSAMQFLSKLAGQNEESAFKNVFEGYSDLSWKLLLLTTLASGFFIIYGALLLMAGDSLSLLDMTNKNRLSKNISIPYWVEKKILWFNKGKYESINIDLSAFSQELRDTLVDRVQLPLNDMYNISTDSKRAEEIYKLTSPYLKTVMDDLSLALSECKNEEMEHILIDRLVVVEQFIKGLKEDIDNAVKTDKDELEIRKSLELKEYSPLGLTEQLNKLL